MRFVPTALLLVGLLQSACSLGSDRTDERGMTALMRAAAEGNVGEAERLIKNGADVDAQVRPIHLRELLAVFRLVPQPPSRRPGWTPLMYAASGGHDDMVRLLLRSGAEPERGPGGVGPLTTAIRGPRSASTVRLLLEAGARPDRSDTTSTVWKPSPLELAIRWKDAETARLLIEAGANVNRRGREGRTALMMAAAEGDTAIVRLLLRAGAVVEAADDIAGRTALMHATASGHEETGRLLREAGAVRDGAKDVALDHAVRMGDSLAVRRLLREGASPNARSAAGDYVLVTAIQLGHHAIVRDLVANRADVNVRHRYIGTPLFNAAQRGDTVLVRILLAAGADARARDGALAVAAGIRSRGPVDSAGPARSLGMTRMLLEAGADAAADGGAALRAAAWSGNLEVVRLLLARGAPINGVDDAQMTPLRRAAGLGHREVVRVLLEAGADVRITDVNGWGALTSAIGSKDPEIVRMLVAAGADVNRRDDDGESPLSYASRMSTPEVVQVLRQAGARE